MIRDLAVALSLANLTFIEVWFDLLFMPQSSTYFLKSPRHAADYEAVIANVLFLAAVLFGALRSFRRLDSPWSRGMIELAFVVLLMFALNALRLNLKLPLGVGRLWHQISLMGLHRPLAIGGLLALLLAMRWRRPLSRAVYLLLLLVSPFALFNLGRAVIAAAGLAPADPFPSHPMATPLPVAEREGPRVLWLLFDELDESMIASRRPPGLVLPELEGLRREALYATNAQPPSEVTITSVPAIFTGRMVASAQATSPAGLALIYAGEQEPRSWADQPNVLCRARAAGFNTAVVGWYHPYCRLFAGCLTECFFEPVYLAVVGRGEPEDLLGRMQEQALATIPINSRRVAIRSYLHLLGQAKAVVSRPGPGLTFVHFSIPHAPAIFDRRRSEFTLGHLSSVEGYVDNVALVDQALGELRRTMEASGTWDRTTLLLTADHAWRESWAFDGRTNRQVPFLLKLAGQRAGLHYPREFNTVVTPDLLLALLRRELQSPADVSAWLDHHAGGASSPAMTAPVGEEEP